MINMKQLNWEPYGLIFNKTLKEKQIWHIWTNDNHRTTGSDLRQAQKECDRVIHVCEP